MLKIYGSMLCPDCVECRKDLDQAGIDYIFYDFHEDLRNLKSFLAFRDGNPLFDPVRQQGNIGIPCLVKEDGSLSLDWHDLI